MIALSPLRLATPPIGTGTVCSALGTRPSYPQQHASTSQRRPCATAEATSPPSTQASPTAEARRLVAPTSSIPLAHQQLPQEPGNLYHQDGNAKELDALIRHPSFRRMAGFASSTFHTWAPKLHAHYADTLDALIYEHPHLQRNFSNSVFAAVAFNFGPRTCSKKHRDHANLPYGWCAVTALGNYNYTRGGHLVLWELGLVLEFPPGCTILLPSAAIAHSNTPVAAHESRTSFAQFTAGGLFRWMAHGFQTDEEFFRGKTPEELAAVAVENEARCKMGLSLFSTFKEIETELRLRGAK
ncbi:hypothetical protein HYPSUDRAFT_140647 [Hypholoma sublateritium FD-334 SS-4]|uniref:Uncharacterized protein n=1 Tax=Hypholoma sublateritium (strain FD-334 SS-4) TaxID=945553 RepID=A0A0D2L3T6_HYPSF|nr:hypothetical protein HYPSUDRAFT_140647 [Hypholoma sublateritium FD-334 SS-4]